MTSATHDKNAYGILTDTTKCVGCNECVEACKAAYHPEEDLPRDWKNSIEELSPHRFTTVLQRPGNRFVRQQCRHCVEPACVSACIVGALMKTPEGPVIDDFSKCIGCRYCMLSCPYQIPRYDWAARVPFMRKCHMCHELVKEGGQPHCTAACKYGATVFGKREELLAVARRRLEAEPDKYVQKVYGESDVGGTCVLYISDIPLGFLGWKQDMGETPLPKLTWASLKKVPPTIGVVGAGMAGVYWVIGRRMRNQALAADAALAAAATAEGPAEGEAAATAANADEKKSEE